MPLGRELFSRIKSAGKG